MRSAHWRRLATSRSAKSLRWGPVSRRARRATASVFPASNNRVAGTPEENTAIVQGSLAYFGTYSVSETDKTITTHVESCTFPNWNGVDRKTSFSISGDELSTHVVSGPLTSVGTGTAYLVWKRAK